MDKMSSESVAQTLANATGAVVYAYERRTSYENTLLTIDERDFIDAVHFYIRKDRTKREYDGYKELENKSELSDKELKRFNFDEIKEQYSEDEVIDLKISHSNFTETCNYILWESGEIKVNKTESLWIAWERRFQNQRKSPLRNSLLII